MGALNNLYVSSSFQGLLKMTDSTNGLTNTLQTIQTGDGDNSPLQMSLTEVNISGSFYINNVPITNGSSGTSGTSGVAGSSGTSGTNGSSGQSGSNGTSGTSGTSGGTGSSGTSGTSGVSGSSGTSGSSGVAGSSGTSGQAGSSGTSGTSGQAGSSGTSGVSGSSGTSGVAGSSGTSGTSGTSGGTGSSGTSGTSGIDGSSGTSGINGSSGTSGVDGSSGTSGSSGISPSTVGFITTGSIGTTQSITGSLVMSGSGNPSNGTLSVGNDGGIILRTVGNNPALIYHSGSASASRKLVLDASENEDTQLVIIGGRNTNGGINIGGGVASAILHSINTPIRITGSLRVIGTSHILTGSLDVRSGSLDLFSNNTTVNTDLYLTSSEAGQSNIIKGWGDNPAAGGAGALQSNYTGSLRITGSNNMVSMPQIRATGIGGGADQQGYISGSDNMILSNNAGILLNTGSLLFPKTQGNIIGNGSFISMNFTTSSLAGGHPILSNNVVLGGGLTLNSNSGSLTTVGQNIILGGSIVSTQNFVTNARPNITGNNVIGGVTLSHISSSINYQSNYNNAPITVNNHLSSSNIANNTLTVANNTFLGGASGTGPSIYVSGSQSSNATRNITNNLLGGNGLQISSSFVSSSNSNLVSSIIFGNSLAVSGSHSGNGGSAFFGRFNATGSNQEDAQSVVFAVGTGTAAGSRKTGFLIDSGSVTRISGSLSVQGGSALTGSLQVTDKINDLKIWTGSATVNSIGIGTNTLAASTGSSLNNVAIGDSALSSNVTGANSVAIGNATLQNSIAGFNIAIGGSALNAATTATENVAIGSSSTQALTLGDKNTAIGFNSMVGVVSGSWNVSIGAGTLQRNISGSNCVALGNQAGSWSTNSNEFFVGNDNYGNQIGEQSSSLFYGKFNNTTVSQSLQINAATDIRNNLVVSGSLTVGGNKQFNVGAFQSDETQSGSANVSQSITYNTTDYSNGVSVVSGSRLTVANAGVYNIQFSAQVDRISGSGTDTVNIWLKKNGTNVTNSAGAITIAGSAAQAKTVSSWNYVVDAAASDYFELCWQTTDSNIQLINVTATGNIPGVPSVIATVTQVR